MFPSSTIDTIEKEVWGQVTSFLKNKNISNDTIHNRMPGYRYKFGHHARFKPPSPTSLKLPKLSKFSSLVKTIKNFSFDKFFKSMRRHLEAVTPSPIDSANDSIPDVDWTCLSGRVRAQGDCGACYAFCTVDNVGAMLGIYYYTFFIELSVENVVDCSQNSLVYGCSGGFL
jgi:hypothetical protein